MDDLLLYFFISHVMIAVTSIFIGGFVLMNSRGRLNVVFALLSFSIALWAIFYALWVSADSYYNGLLYSRALNFFAIFIPVFYFHWLVLFLDIEKKMKYWLWSVYCLGSIFLIFGFNDIFVSGVKQILFFQHYPQSGILHTIFLMMWVIIVGYGAIALSLEYKKTTGERKKQVLFAIIGGTIGFIGGSFNFLLMLDIDIVAPFASIGVLAFPLFIGYAMMKYQFMNIKLVFIQSLIILLNAFAIGFIFLSNSAGEYIAKIIFAFMTMIISYLLKKSYDKEIEQRVKLEKASMDLKRANIELKRLDKAKSEFISIASHQLRTPLTAIKGYVSLILEGAYGKTDEKISTVLNKVFMANDRLINLMEDLLNITRMESGRLEYNIEEDVQLDEILEELKDLFILRTKEKKLDFQIKTLEGGVPPVKADKAKTREVISNLIDNAIKYTNEGFVHVSLEENRKILKVVVEDSGVGISKESIKTLFSKFSRGTDDTKVYTEGTGLGLYVGKNLIESQGGRIYAESEGSGKGSKFVVEMPIAE